MAHGTDVCVVFAAGEYYPGARIEVPRGAFVVAADGGLDHARALGVVPDVIVGDFDSVRGPVPGVAGESAAAAGGGRVPRTIALPALKDDPDLLSALKVGWAAGGRTFHIHGALGGRIDHTIANIQLLAQVAAHGGIAYLYGDGDVVTAISDGALTFPAGRVVPGRMVSVFSHADESRGVSETGLKYELRDASMRNTQVVGVSNEFLAGVEARIAVADGTLTVTFPQEAGEPLVERFHAFHGDLGPLDTEVSPLLNAAAR
ncbi:thiamine diphosphokinase [Bifidobacterium pullorum subsp. saeculare]|uniref:Thiamine diphosphokinase n=1 Tax=Bifidobacterium pullorum subsp. saeculare TaxID=78257 RepID=A0A938WVI3_9BIFI|nr:thiamine diphosphokinase [Bifidobacterium pullorum]MBM6698979.1 thiamine diphosphokinase [Bifidobacterium pullorum subsp. saeculare]